MSTDDCIIDLLCRVDTRSGFAPAGFETRCGSCGTANAAQPPTLVGAVGSDAGTQVDGLLVATLGVLLVVVVTTASIQDASSVPVLEPRVRGAFV